MSMRRYFGRAHGTRRIKKSRKIPKLSFLTWMLLALGAMLALGAIVWIVDPGSNVPDEEKGTQYSSGVTPTTTPHPPVSKTSGSSSAPAQEHKPEPAKSSASPSPKPKPRSSPPATATPSPTSTPSTTPSPSHSPRPQVYTFILPDSLSDICALHQGPEIWTGPQTGVKYWSYHDNQNPEEAFRHKAVEIPGESVSCPSVPIDPPPVIP